MARPPINLNDYDDNDPASRPDDGNPELTAEQVKKARPALDVVAEVFGAGAAQSLKRGRGRPEKTGRKINQTLRLDADVLEAYKGEGTGWQVRITSIQCCVSTIPSSTRNNSPLFDAPQAVEPEQAGRPSSRRFL